jgi:membrane protein
MAATMTYYLVLSVFPLLLVLVSLLNLLGGADTVVPALERMLDGVLPPEVISFTTTVIHSFLTSQGAGLVLVIGVVAALWSASSYIGAFTRAMNRVYGVVEGRPVVRLRAAQLGLTLVLAATICLLGSAVVLSERVAAWLGHGFGGGARWIALWSGLRLPVIGVLGVALLAVLYYWAPNVRRPRRRIWSPGALIALVLSGAIGWGFDVYLNVFNGASKYARTYGTLAGLIIGLFLLWLINVMILVGAEVDAALERVIELRSGLDAREGLLLPPRDGRQVRRGRVGRTALVERAGQLLDDAVARGAEPSDWYVRNALDPSAPDADDDDRPDLWRRALFRVRGRQRPGDAG